MKYVKMLGLLAVAAPALRRKRIRDDCHITNRAGLYRDYHSGRS